MSKQRRFSWIWRLAHLHELPGVMDDNKVWRGWIVSASKRVSEMPDGLWAALAAAGVAILAMALRRQRSSSIGREMDRLEASAIAVLKRLVDRYFELTAHNTMLVQPDSQERLRTMSKIAKVSRDIGYRCDDFSITRPGVRCITQFSLWDQWNRFVYALDDAMSMTHGRILKDRLEMLRKVWPSILREHPEWEPLTAGHEAGKAYREIWGNTLRLTGNDDPQGNEP